MKILNFGSLNIDHVYTVDHIVRPGETIGSGGYSQFCGGKGLNQSIALARAGADVWHAGKIGGEGMFLKDRLAKDGVNTDFVGLVEGPSGHAIIQVDAGGENSIVIYGGANQSILREDVERVLSAFEVGDTLLLQNEISAMSDILEVAGAKGLRVVFNPAPFGPEVLGFPLEHVDLFIVNETEGEGLTGKTKAREIAAELRRRYPKAAVIVTLGAKGALHADGDMAYEVAAPSVAAVDTTAAGDTFIGYFLALHARGRGVQECMEVACKAAALCVTRPGAADSIPALGDLDG